jgi:hypothetical protein
VAHEILSYYAQQLTDTRVTAMRADSDADQAMAKATGSDKARQQALHEASDLPRAFARNMQYSSLTTIYGAMRRIYSVWSVIEALDAGAATRAAAARTKSDDPHRVLREQFSWGTPQLPGPIGEDVREPVETAEVSYVDTPHGPGLRLHGANTAETDLTQLPGLPSPKEVGNNVQVQHLGSLQRAITRQSDLLRSSRASPPFVSRSATN